MNEYIVKLPVCAASATCEFFVLFGLFLRRGESSRKLEIGGRSSTGLREGGGGGGGGGRGEGSPPQAVMCAALCLAHVLTGTSAALLTREKIMAAALTLSGLLDVCVDKIEAVVAEGEGGGGERGAGSSGEPMGGTPSKPFPVAVVMKCATSALWGCLSSLSGNDHVYNIKCFFFGVGAMYRICAGFGLMI